MSDLRGRHPRRNIQTQEYEKTIWREAKEVLSIWETAGIWDAPDGAHAIQRRMLEPPEPEPSKLSITIQFATDAYLANRAGRGIAGRDHRQHDHCFQDFKEIA